MTNRAMKDSGVEWIGEIPDKWIVGKVQNAFYRKKEKANDVNPTILSLARSGIKVRDISNNEGQLAADYSNYNPVSVGDVLLNPMDLVSGANCNISNIEGVISPAYINLRAKTDYSGKYYNYYFKLQYWSYAFFAHGKGVSYENRWTLNNETIMKYPIPVPSYEEQQKIAAFLDEKVAHIDNIIEETKKSIENLKAYKQSLITETVTKGLDSNVEMKDSGIDWIGEIPKHWNPIKLKYLVKLRNEKRNYEKGDSYIGLENIESYNGRINSVQIDYNSGLTDFFKKGDVLFNKLRPYLAKGFIADFDAFGSGELLVLTQYKGDKRFLLYYLLSSKFIDVINSSTYGAKMPRANWDFIKELSIITPTKEEQGKIANFLDEKSKTIDSTIEQKEQLITELEAYKKSLIYEYVTGKKEVK